MNPPHEVREWQKNGEKWAFWEQFWGQALRTISEFRQSAYKITVMHLFMVKLKIKFHLKTYDVVWWAAEILIFFFTYTVILN